MFCNYLSVSLAMLFIARKTKLIGDFLFVSLYFLILVCAAFTISSGLGGIGLLIGIWYWVIYRKQKKIFARLSLTGAILFVVLFCLMNLFALEPYSTAPYSINLPFFDKVLYPSPRLLIWTAALQTFSENFFFGNGLGLPVCRVLFQNTDGNFSLLTDAHNIFLSVAAQNGVFGLIAITAIIIYFLRHLFPPKTPENFTTTAFTGLNLAFLSAFVFQGLTGSFEDTRHLWILIGLILSVDFLTKNNPAEI
jgi:O-antigen ligase